MTNKFFTFINPYLNFIDKGDLYRKPFSWMYMLIAVINLIFPFHMLYLASGIFSYISGTAIVGFLLTWLGIVFTSWLSFQLWWNRKDKVLSMTSSDAEFVAIPVYTHFIQTTGEWLGMYVAIVGCWSSIIAVIFSQSPSMFGMLGRGMMHVGITSIFLAPIIGFLIVIGARVIAELFRALASIANNTKK